MFERAESPYESLRRDREVMDDVLDILHSRKKVKVAGSDIEEVVSKRSVISFLETPQAEAAATDQADIEAIVLTMGRPSLLVDNNAVQIDDIQLPALKKRLRTHEAGINRPLPSVGRVELMAHPNFEWVGTGWMLPDRVLVTNRHVANVFAERRQGAFVFRNFFGNEVSARIDFLEEYRNADQLEFEVESILYIADTGAGRPDIAFLKMKDHADLPAPLDLADRDAELRHDVGVVGYPAHDGMRNPGPAMPRIFQDIYDVKRYAPGTVSAIENNVLMHDCSTLGGNSGSPIVDQKTGHVVGLHYAGRFRRANYGVPVSVIKRELQRLGSTMVPVGDDPTHTLESLTDREGYREDFLGRGRHRVPLPRLSRALEEDAAPVRGRERSRGANRYVLDYTHFSIVMNKRRRLAIYTAVNIDGTEEVVVRRRNTRWRIDPRLDRDHQFDNALYRRNRLDRGHMVRRLDPVWGTDEEARQANDDTYHYTNSCPQHELLNQREWLDLENYLLHNTNRDDQLLSVFTGPVFSDRGVRYRGATLPDEFWKVAVMATHDGLLATGYLLSQTDFLDDIEFTLGPFRTYQVPISVIEHKTNLQFGLSEFDPLSRIESFQYPIIEGEHDIVLG